MINITSVDGYINYGVGAANVRVGANPSGQTALHTSSTLKVTSNMKYYLNCYHTAGTVLNVLAVFSALKVS